MTPSAMISLLPVTIKFHIATNYTINNQILCLVSNLLLFVVDSESLFSPVVVTSLSECGGPDSEVVTCHHLT